MLPRCNLNLPNHLARLRRHMSFIKLSQIGVDNTLVGLSWNLKIQDINTLNIGISDTSHKKAISTIVYQDIS